MELMRNRLSLQSDILLFFSSQAGGVVVDLLRLAKGDFMWRCLLGCDGVFQHGLGYFGGVIQLLSDGLRVEGFSETLCGGLSQNGLHKIYLNV